MIRGVSTSTAGFVGVVPNGQHIGEAVPLNNWTQFVTLFAAEGSESTPLVKGVYSYFLNGGQRCYVSPVAKNAAISGDDKKRSGLKAFESVDEIAIVAAPGYTDGDSCEALLGHCESMGDRFCIIDAPQGLFDIEALKEVALTETGDGEKKRKGVRPRNSTYGAYYFPWFLGRDPLDTNIKHTPFPPSGALAGICARVDATRGVHKAPANEAIRGALGLEYQVTRSEQAQLNRLGVNCIRYFPQSGIRVWGARTLAEPGDPMTYINVRRLFNMIKESIEEGTRWCVFEPNDYTLWKSLERDISAFLMVLWRGGALLGATPEQAFFVKCDDETNTPETIELGQVITEIGIAPVKPAEFIIFKIAQKAIGEAEAGG